MSSRTTRTLFADADNTLWDTDAVYAEAQLELLADVERLLGTLVAESERLAFVRQRDQEIARSHQLGLRYPPRLLIRAMISNDSIPEEQVLGLESEFIERIRGAVPPLRPGVRTGMEQLHLAGVPVFIVTESSEASSMRLLATHKLAHLVVGIHSVRKIPKIYSQLRSPQQIQYFVGDQLDVDILLPHGAGFRTIYFPGGFVPQWIQGQEDVSDFHIRSFDEIPGIVLSDAASDSIKTH